MSEIKVNKLTPRTNCGTVTLGDSGDTFTIPAGVSITNQGTASGFGATGAASWTTTVKTGDFTAVAGEGYFVDTSSGSITVSLPAGSAGAVVAIKDYASTFSSNNCTIDANGSDKIGGRTDDVTLSTDGIAITLIFIDSTQGWLVTDDGLQSSANNNPFLQATGGTVTTSGNDKIHTFTGPGTFSVSAVANCAANNEVSYIVVGGGASGGGGYRAGGGGAGGFRESKSPVTPYTASPIEGACAVTVTATDFPITIGAGGSAVPYPSSVRGNPGSSSIFSTITSAGGGGGGSNVTPYGSCKTYGLSGASGGGGAANTGSPTHPGGTGNTPPVSPPQGNSGGAGRWPASGGGGGGAGGVGSTNPGSANGSAGGAGVTSEITASPVARAGGGGGGGNTPSGSPGAGGTGGGGAGGSGSSPICGTAGTANTGGGGGGGGGGEGTGATGGSGVVVIRYKFQ